MVSRTVPAEHLLVDARFGVITRLRPYIPSPTAPRSWVGWSAHVSDTTVFADWQGERYGFGAALGDHDRARRAAVGEAVERYCGNAVPPHLEIATFDALTASGRPAVDPDRLALYSESQYGASGFPFCRFTRELPVAWVKGRNMLNGDETMLPASLVYLNYLRGVHAEEPRTNALIYAGIATGQTREHAERFALEELFERDANTIWWASGGPHTEIKDELEIALGSDLIARDGNVDSVVERSEIRLLHIPSEFCVPVIAVFVEDHARDLISYGTACRATPREAAKKAFVEAVAMLELAAELDDPDSAYWQAIRWGNVPAGAHRPYRPDRRYREEFRDDYRDINDLPAVAQLYLDPRMQGHPLDRLRTTPWRATLAELPAQPVETARACYLEELAACGMTAYSVDVTTSDVRAAGLVVVRVIVPGLYGNPPAAFPYLGGARLYNVPVRLRLVERPLSEPGLYPHPIPHV